MRTLRPAVFLDRDGTINVEKDYLYKISEFEYLDRAVEAMGIFRRKGYLIVIITNQSGIARGFYTEDDFKTLNDWMIGDLRSKGIEVAEVLYCPHHPEAKIERYRVDCDCRKPGTGLFWKAQKDLGIDMERSIAIGDRIRDLCICKESGVKGYLLGENNLLDIAKTAIDFSMPQGEEASEAFDMAQAMKFKEIDADGFGDIRSAGYGPCCI